MNYDLPRALRLTAGRALLAASRVLARHGAHLIGHPSALPRVPALRSTHATDAANVHDIRRGAL